MVKARTVALEAWRFYVRNRERGAALRNWLRARSVRGRNLSPKYTVVSAVYNVDRYLDQYFRTIVMQPEFVDEIQLIAVNDGSTDGSRATLEKWRRRFPDNIIILDQENAGQAAARNTGLEHARGTWVTFIDPDDFIERNYFTHVARFIQRHDYEGYPLQFVSCNMIMYRESNRRYENNHPLKYRFERDIVVPLSRLGKYIQLSASAAIFRRSRISEMNLWFNPLIRPSFEDADFVARFILSCPTGRAGFLRAARYYYRRRRDGSSTLNAAITSPARYEDVYKHGYLPLLESVAVAKGAVPAWLQFEILYDIMWQIRGFMNKEHDLAFLDAAQIEQYDTRLCQVFRHIDSGLIQTFTVAGTQEVHRVGTLARYKGESPVQPRARIESVDLARKGFDIRWVSGHSTSEGVFAVDGITVSPVEVKAALHTFLGKPFAYEHRARITAPLQSSLSAKIDGVDALIEATGYPASLQVDLSAPTAAAAEPRVKAGLSTRARRLRALSRSPAVAEAYCEAWLLIDRDIQADDNAEHLYRHLRAHNPEINAYFVLRRDSHDWSRLEDEGFRMLEFGTEAFECALLNAQYLISSHADFNVNNYRPARENNDLLRFKFVFLQHGITKDDLSAWLNQKSISLMCTATYAEHASMARAPTRCRLFPSEVALTGFPRHDRLIAESAASERRVLIMPTWRQSVVGKPIPGQTNSRVHNADFSGSEFARMWRSFLRSARLEDMLRSHSYSATFYPHLLLQPYLDCFDVPPHINVITHKTSGSIQDVFLAHRAIVTDYSSVAFEMALIDRPVLYYQFDRAYVFNGGHTYRKGYFDYERDGFGPVCLDEETLLDQLEATLARDGVMEPVYAKRAQETFAWRDARNCERVVAAIEQLNRPFAERMPPLTDSEGTKGQEAAWMPRDAAE